MMKKRWLITALLAACAAAQAEESKEPVDVLRQRLADAQRDVEAEVARLEKLRAEDEARKQAEEAEKARLAAEEAAKKAAEEAAAKKAADEAAAKKAAEDAAAKKAAEDAAAQEEAIKKALEDFNNQPMDIGFGN